MSSQVVTFYEDKEMTKAILPRTKVSAISDDSGTALSEMVLYHGDGIDSDRVLIDADLLQGHDASYFTPKTEFDIKVEELNTSIENSGLQMDLLWTNVSPTSNFGPQTIELDLANYNLLMIEVKPFTTSGNTVSSIISKNTQQAVISVGVGSEGATNASYRLAQFNDTSIIFGGSGWFSSDYSNSYYANAHEQNIPYKIYGIK